MKLHLGIACLFLIYPATLTAQDKVKTKPEALLAADVLVFVRYDGYEPHRQAYDRTTLARVMKEDLGDFLDYVATFARAQLFTLAQDDGKGQPRQVEKAAAETSKFMEYFWRHGVAIGVDIASEAHLVGGHPRLAPQIDAELPGLQLTVVLPEAGLPKNRDVVFPFLNLLAGLGRFEIVERKDGQRTIHGTTHAGLKLAWWQEGDHVIVRLGSEPIRQAIDIIEGRRPNLTSSPRFRDLCKFDRYETDLRGLVNVERVLDLLRTPGESDGHLALILEAFGRHMMLHHLGATGLKGLSFHLGFDGKYQRSTVLLDVVERPSRGGLLRLFSGDKEVTLDKLPAMPPDAATVALQHVNWEAAYDFLIQTSRLYTLAMAMSEGRFPRAEDGFNPDELLGLEVRKDIIGTLDTTVLSWNAHSEGPFFLGQALAVKLKDAKKLAESLVILNKLMNERIGGIEGWGFRSRKYRGVDLFTLSGPRGMSIPVTYAIHKDWLVLGLFPQAVKGYIMRSEGKYRAWQQPAHLAEILARDKKDAKPGTILAGASVTDPRPTFEIALALLPACAQAMNAVAGTSFDVTQIPNAQAINEFLYPTVSLFYDDDTTLRWESHFAADLPTGAVLVLPMALGFLMEMFF